MREGASGFIARFVRDVSLFARDLQRMRYCTYKIIVRTIVLYLPEYIQFYKKMNESYKNIRTMVLFVLFSVVFQSNLSLYCVFALLIIIYGLQRAQLLLHVAADEVKGGGGSAIAAIRDRGRTTPATTSAAWATQVHSSEGATNGVHALTGSRWLLGAHTAHHRGASHTRCCSRKTAPHPPTHST